MVLRRYFKNLKLHKHAKKNPNYLYILSLQKNVQRLNSLVNQVSTEISSSYTQIVQKDEKTIKTINDDLYKVEEAYKKLLAIKDLGNPFNQKDRKNLFSALNNVFKRLEDEKLNNMSIYSSKISEKELDHKISGVLLPSLTDLSQALTLSLEDLQVLERLYKKSLEEEL